MAEPPHKRARRPDSNQMWDEADRRLPTRERDEPARERDRRDDRDRRTRYRSRSPPRGGRDRNRDRDRDQRRDDGRAARDPRGARRDDRPRDRDRGRERDGARESRDRPRERSRDRERERDSGRRPTRSRSPRPEREDDRRDGDRDANRARERENTRSSLRPDEDISESRTATPPVSFKVSGTGDAQDHDRMDVDGSRKGDRGDRNTTKDKIVEDQIEDDDDIVVEDDGMAAMQAMMGFGGFGTTHMKKVAGNDVSAVRKEKKVEYRQYMNRVGGFNRPLSPTRE